MEFIHANGFFVIVFGGITIWTFIAAVKDIAMRSAAEKTKREIAAYIAEGSMTPEQGERILRAANPKRDQWC